MKTVRYYEVTKNTDTTEGRGGTVSTGISFTNLDEAVAFVMSEHYKKFAVMGALETNKEHAKFNVRGVNMEVYDHVGDYVTSKVTLKHNIESALGKLSQYEQTLLGIDIDEIERRLKKL